MTTPARIVWWQVGLLLSAGATSVVVTEAVTRPTPPPPDRTEEVLEALAELGEELEALEAAQDVLAQDLLALEPVLEYKGTLEELEAAVAALPVEFPRPVEPRVHPDPGPALGAILARQEAILEALEAAVVACRLDTLRLVVERRGGRFVLRTLEAGPVEWGVK